MSFFLPLNEVTPKEKSMFIYISNSFNAILQFETVIWKIKRFAVLLAMHGPSLKNQERDTCTSQFPSFIDK